MSDSTLSPVRVGSASSSTTPKPETPAWRHCVTPWLSAATLATRVAALGAEITQTYRHVLPPAGNAPCDADSLCVVGVLKGCLVFVAELLRHIDLPLTVQFISISSYGNATTSSGVVQITQDLQQSIENKHVLLVEDIVDSGLSMAYLLNNFATRRPQSLRVCSLLAKPLNTQVPVQLDYVGFHLSNHFVVGYGMDHAGLYRNLPFIGVYKPPEKSHEMSP